MSVHIDLLPGAIGELFAHASDSGTVTVADRYGLLAAILTESLEDEERLAIDRLLRLAQQGKLVMVGDLSAEG